MTEKWNDVDNAHEESCFTNHVTLRSRHYLQKDDKRLCEFAKENNIPEETMKNYIGHILFNETYCGDVGYVGILSDEQMKIFEVTNRYEFSFIESSNNERNRIISCFEI